MNNEVNSSDSSSINLLDVLSLVWAKKAVAILIVILCAVGGALYHYFFVNPKYVSEAKIIIFERENKSFNNEVAVGTYLVTDYAEMITDRIVLEKVIKNLDLSVSYEGLKSCVSVNNPEDSRILEVFVSSKKPKFSQKVANEICAVTKVEAVDVFGPDKVNIFSPASLPKINSAISMKYTVLLGMLVGLLFVFAIALIFTATDDKIKSSDDVEKYLNLCTLATIPFNSVSGSKKKRYNKRKAAKYY